LSISIPVTTRDNQGAFLMKQFKKSILLLTAIAALAALTMPAMASAATWGPVNTNGTLLGTVDVNVPGYSGYFNCLSTLGYHVRTPASSLLDVTSASFTNCYAGGGWFDQCNMTMTATGLPWTLNGTHSYNIPISISASGSFSGGGNCILSGATFTLSSSPPNAWGAWDAATHTVGNISNRPVTFTIIGVGSPPSYLTATFRNPTQTLTLA
jgi:hypothetical protein